MRAVSRGWSQDDKKTCNNRNHIRSRTSEHVPLCEPGCDDRCSVEHSSPSLSRSTSTVRRRRASHFALKRRTLTVVLGIMALLFWTTLSAFWDSIVLARFKLRDRAYERGLVKGCRLRKKPLLFVHGEDELVLVWESNCKDADFQLRWGEIDHLSKAHFGVYRNLRRSVQDDSWGKLARLNMVEMENSPSTRAVYQAFLKDLRRGATYGYKLSIRISEDSHASHKLLAEHEFPWTQKSMLADTSTVHIALLADNQYNLRVFHRILTQMIRYSLTLPWKPSPRLLIHAGDQVQNPHNLPQWQTDFWDPLTSLLPKSFGQTTPILLARGNHDWDSTGVNAYTGGSPARQDWLTYSGKSRNKRHLGTYLAYSPHERCRILVLDSNLDLHEQREQEDWLEWEASRSEWTQASLRLVVVHVPPFLEYWDKRAWELDGESKWSSYVRKRLSPILARHNTTLVMSGHQHAYSRGKLSYERHSQYTSAMDSTRLETLEQPNNLPGVVYTIFGGAGGTLDRDKVEEWGFYERSIRGVHHFVWMSLDFGLPPSIMDERDKSTSQKQKNGRIYRTKRDAECDFGWTSVLDKLTWKTISLQGEEIDAFQILAEGCS